MNLREEDCIWIVVGLEPGRRVVRCVVAGPDVEEAIQAARVGEFICFEAHTVAGPDRIVAMT